MARAAAETLQYFARYAEPEAALASGIAGQYAAALVVPVCRESSAFLEGYRAALEASSGRVLVVVVVNGAADAAAETHAGNAQLLADLSLRFAGASALVAPSVHTPAFFARDDHCDVLWLDRASANQRLPRGEGVGLARKIGGDLAALLAAHGQLACAQIACSDADATLPSDFFARLAEAAAGERRSALLWPFRHDSGGDPAIDAATTLYEISLRYYVLGLSAARSPYAYQSIGSSLCFDAAAYAAVRGFPKRAAAEDFYLLDKLAKVGPLRRLAGEPIRLRARASDRVPFGTGRRTREIAELGARGAELELYSPDVFRALGAVLNGLDAFASSGEAGALRAAVEEIAGELAGPVLAVLEELHVFAAIAAASNQARAGSVLRRRAHTWFDSLRTLRFIHLLRDARLPSLPWREALASAPFVADAFRDGATPDAVRARLALTEMALPELVGPTL